MQSLEISSYLLSSTQTTIFGFNSSGMCLMGKIKLKCQIDDLKIEVTCYVIDDETSYNLLVRRLYIHRNGIVSSTMHQVMKYIDEQGEVQKINADQNPFKGVDNYFTDSLLYQEQLVTRPELELPYSDNKANA